MPGASEVQPPTLTDGLVILDALTLDDVEAHLGGEDEEQARRFGWYPARSSIATVTAAIERWQEQWWTDGDTRTFATRDAATLVLVGGCQLRLRADEIAEASYWTYPAFRGRGYATRALRLLCEYGFSALGVERLELYLEPDNEASRAVARGAGFREEGLLRARERLGKERRYMLLYARLPSDS